MVELVPKVSTKVDFKLRFSYLGGNVNDRVRCNLNRVRRLNRFDRKLRPGWPSIQAHRNVTRLEIWSQFGHVFGLSCVQSVIMSLSTGG
jgi:hypothetical protein